jgi:hypothetical protein
LSLDDPRSGPRIAPRVGGEHPGANARPTGRGRHAPGTPTQDHVSAGIVVNKPSLQIESSVLSFGFLRLPPCFRPDARDSQHEVTDRQVVGNEPPSQRLYFNTRNYYGPAMQKKPTRKLKTLRLRKEALQILSTEQQLRVHAGDPNDPWDTAYPQCQNA